MSELANSLSERQEEFTTHLSLAFALEFQILSGESSIGETTLSARHLLTMKSGLLVHLYNIVESTMTKSMRMIGQAIGETSPNEWTTDALREWLRKNAPVNVEGSDETRLEIIHKASTILMTGEPLGRQELKKPSGTWTDKKIITFARRLGCEFTLSPEMHMKMSQSPEWGDQSPLQFLADRRNAIAHGRRSFEQGANDMTLQKIKQLSSVVLEYLEKAIEAFETYVDTEAFREEGNTP